MSSVRLSTESLQSFQAILNTYRTVTNPGDKKAVREDGYSRSYGRKRLATVEQMLAESASVDVATGQSSIDKASFLKKMAAFAYVEYSASWTKARSGLSAQILIFVANELNMQKTQTPVTHIVPYAQPFELLVEEKDKDFFKRVNEKINPTPPAVKKFLASTEDRAVVRCYAGIPITDAQRKAKADADARAPNTSEDRAVVRSYAGIPITDAQRKAKADADAKAPKTSYSFRPSPM
jgi:hypothetical protein